MKLYNFDGLTPQGPARADQQAFLLAVEFHESALRAAATELDSEGPISALVPMIVAYAFACELYLKALARASSGRAPAKSHRLSVLYQRLAPDVATAVAAAYRGRTGRTTGELLGDVTALSDAFVEWRYIYEGDERQLHTALLAALSQSLFETCRHFFPEWNVKASQDAKFRAPEPRNTMTVKNFGGGTFLEAIDGTPDRDHLRPD